MTDIGEVPCVVKESEAQNAHAIVPRTPHSSAQAFDSLPPPAPAPSRKPDIKEYTFVVKPVFDKNGTPVMKKDRKTFSRILTLLKSNLGLTVEIEVYGDRHGTDKASKRIGLKKAEAIRHYLLISGVKADRIKKVESLGNKKLICKKPTTACDRINRRGVIRIVMEAAQAA